MKKLVLIAAVAALSACNQNKAEPAPAASEAAATPAAAASAPTMADRAGTYSYDDGKKESGTSVMNKDGSYTDTSTDGKDVETGTWKVDDAGKVCFDPKGDDPKEPTRCYALSEPDADGNMNATDDKGEIVKVKKTA